MERKVETAFGGVPYSIKLTVSNGLWFHILSEEANRKKRLHAHTHRQHTCLAYSFRDLNIPNYNLYCRLHRSTADSSPGRTPVQTYFPEILGILPQ